MIKHNLWSNDGPGLRYEEGDPRPWVLDTWCDETHKFVRSYIGCRPHGTMPSGIYLRSVQQRNRVNLESQLAMEFYK